MGFKKRLEPFHFFDLTGKEQPIVVTGTNTYISLAENTKNTDNTGIQLIWTGTPTGTFTVSISPDGNLYDDIVPSPAIVQPAGSAGHWSVNINQTPMSWVRVTYVNASGSGTIDAIITAKDLN